MIIKLFKYFLPNKYFIHFYLINYLLGIGSSAMFSLFSSLMCNYELLECFLSCVIMNYWTTPTEKNKYKREYFTFMLIFSLIFVILIVCIIVRTINSQ